MAENKVLVSRNAATEQNQKHQLGQKAIKEIRMQSGLSQEDFAAKFSLPINALQDWESEKARCPKFYINLLDRTVNEGVPMAMMNTKASFYDPDFLYELGYCYQELLYCMDKSGKDWVENSSLEPLYSLTMIHDTAGYNIPDWLEYNIMLVISHLKEEDYSLHLDETRPICPTESGRQFELGMAESRKYHRRMRHE